MSKMLKEQREKPSLFPRVPALFGNQRKRSSALGREEERYRWSKLSWNIAKYGLWSPLKNLKQEATWLVLHLEGSLMTTNSWSVYTGFEEGGILNWEEIFLGEDYLIQSISSSAELTVPLPFPLNTKQE